MQELTEIFKILDEENKSHINRSDIRNILQNFVFINLPAREIENIISKDENSEIPK